MKNFIMQLRKRHRLSQEELAKKVGVTRQAIIDIEKGKYLPNLLLAYKITKALHTSLEMLFVFEENQEKPDYIH